MFRIRLDWIIRLKWHYFLLTSRNAGPAGNTKNIHRVTGRLPRALRGKFGEDGQKDRRQRLFSHPCLLSLPGVLCWREPTVLAHNLVPDWFITGYRAVPKPFVPGARAAPVTPAWPGNLAWGGSTWIVLASKVTIYKIKREVSLSSTWGLLVPLPD